MPGPKPEASRSGSVTGGPATVKALPPRRTATPTATDKITNTNFAGAARRSRQAILDAVRRYTGTRQSLFIQPVALDTPVRKNNHSISVVRELPVVCYQDQGGPFFAIQLQKQL